MIEDAGDLDAQAVLAAIAEEQGLGAALAFVVAGARSDGVYMAPGARGMPGSRSFREVIYRHVGANSFAPTVQSGCLFSEIAQGLRFPRAAGAAGDLSAVWVAALRATGQSGRAGA